MGKKRLKKYSKSYAHSAFINIPYDSSYESLYLALIAGLSGYGLIPKATLQIPGSRRRLDRIINLLNSCAFSFHDLSCVEPLIPRFNMPFELGLAVAWATKVNRNHNWFIFESKGFRVQQSLSDLNGTEAYIHKGTGIGLLSQLANALVRTKHQPTVKQLKSILHDLKLVSIELKKNLATNSLFNARSFNDLVAAAAIIAKKKIPSLNKAN
jgi:hypothetical protein